jgi:SAM-dependent methyltransferase
MSGAQRTRCPLCGGASLAALPVPGGGAMLSDGRIVDRRLDRASCLDCGCAFHRDAPGEAEVAAWYAQDYGLPAAAPEADAARAAAYARWLRGVSSNNAPQSVLDVGAGSGALLRVLAARFPGAELAGCEPAAPAGHTRLEERASLYRGDITAIPAAFRADWAISVNVIEHVPDPVAFLAAMAGRLAPGGELLVVCPDGSLPGVELMFVDHLVSFTPAAFAHASAQAGLEVVRTERAPPEMGDFRVYVVRAGKSRPDPARADATALAEARASYLRSWQGLDAALQSRLAGGPAAAFGAGEMAALLRAYAPVTWSGLERVVLDRPAEAWPLGKPVGTPDQAGAAALLLAVAPPKQARLAGRFETEGRRSVRFDDLVPR